MFSYKAVSQNAEKNADFVAKNLGHRKQLAKVLYNISIDTHTTLHSSFLYNILLIIIHQLMIELRY